MNTSKYITFVDALGEPGKALLKRDLEAEQVRGALTYAEYRHLAMEQTLVREYRGLHERRNPVVQFERQPDEGLL